MRNRKVASGRDRAGVAKALGRSDDLLAVELDVTKPGDADLLSQFLAQKGLD